MGPAIYTVPADPVPEDTRIAGAKNRRGQCTEPSAAPPDHVAPTPFIGNEMNRQPDQSRVTVGESKLCPVASVNRVRILFFELSERIHIPKLFGLPGQTMFVKTEVGFITIDFVPAVNE